MPRVRRKVRGGDKTSSSSSSAATAQRQSLTAPPPVPVQVDVITPTSSSHDLNSLRSPSAMSTSSVVSPRNGHVVTNAGHKRKCSRCSTSSQMRSRSSSPSDDEMGHHQRKHRRRSSLLDGGGGVHRDHNGVDGRRGSPSSSVSPSMKPMRADGTSVCHLRFCLL